MNKTLPYILCCMMLLVHCGAFAANITFQHGVAGYSGTIDSDIRKDGNGYWDPNENYGDNKTLFLESNRYNPK